MSASQLDPALKVETGVGPPVSFTYFAARPLEIQIQLPPKGGSPLRRPLWT